MRLPLSHSEYGEAGSYELWEMEDWMEEAERSYRKQRKPQMVVLH